MSQSVPIYLPAHPTKCTQKLNGPYFGDSESWTAGRCHRLLQPITSWIELLRKDPVRFTAANDIASFKDLAAALDVNSARDAKGSKVNDTYWTTRRKRVRKTYSARCKLKGDSRSGRIRGALISPEDRSQGQKLSLEPGEFLVPTPILNRSRSLIVDSGSEIVSDLSSNVLAEAKNTRAPQSRNAIKDGDVCFEPSETMHQISKKTNSIRYKVYEGIYNSLDALFEATMLYDKSAQLLGYDKSCRYQHQSSSSWKVPRSSSLLLMCLRSVPTYIKEEEKRALEEAKELGHKPAFDTHVIWTEIYSDLESFGTTEKGWKYLKTVVRMHGVHVICDAIQEGLLDAHFASALVMLCVHASVPGDAEILLTSLLKVARYPNPKTTQSQFRDNSLLLPLLTLEKFTKYTERDCYYHRQVANLITGGFLPATWLGTRYFSSVWISVFHSLSNDPSNRDATIFMTSILPLLCTAQSSRVGKRDQLSLSQSSMLSVLDNTLESVLITLSAMSILSHARNISHILRSTIIDCQLISSKLNSNGAALVRIANILTSVEVNEDVSFIREQIKSLGECYSHICNPPGLKGRLSSFVCSVARCCGRGSSGNGFEYLKIMLERLMALAALENLDGGWVLQEIIVESAFVFQDHLPDERHVQYAQNIRAQVRECFIRPEPSPSIYRVNIEPGFRWEEGINEWVITSPAIKLKGTQVLRLSSSDEDSDCETPIRLSLKRHRRMAMPHTVGKARPYRYSRMSDFVPASSNKYHEDLDPPIQKDHQTYDRALPGQYSLQKSSSFKKSTSRGRPVGKLHSLGRDYLHSRQNWGLFQDTGDELNLVTTTVTATSSDSAHSVLLQLPNSMTRNRKKGQRSIITIDKPPAGEGASFQEQSEDELGL